MEIDNRSSSLDPVFGEAKITPVAQADLLIDSIHVSFLSVPSEIPVPKYLRLNSSQATDGLKIRASSRVGCQLPFRVEMRLPVGYPADCRQEVWLPRETDRHFLI